MTAAACQALAQTLTQRSEEISSLPVVAGFDGFVDELIHVVGERKDLSTYEQIPTIAEFAGVIGGAAGRSSLREIVVTSVDAGGCAVNLGDGIASMGVQLDYFGTLGTPRHAAFDAFADKCRSCTGWAKEPGRTLALEFNDGKYMLSAVTQLQDFNTDLIGDIVAEGSFASACAQAQLIAITNWTLYPHMTACWAKLQEDVFKKLSHKPHFFIDLVDPRSRSEQDIRAMLDVLPGFEAAGYTTFGGNLNEANVLATLLGLPTTEEDAASVTKQAEALKEALGVSQVAVHCLKGASCAGPDGSAWVDGPYTPTPKKSTGAGDRFNAGYCLGLLLGLSPEARLLLGSASSGFFVRNARSGSLDEIIGFLTSWADGSLSD